MSGYKQRQRRTQYEPVVKYADNDAPLNSVIYSYI